MTTKLQKETKKALEWERTALRSELKELRRQRGDEGRRILELGNNGTLTGAVLGGMACGALERIEERVHEIFYRLNQIKELLA